jgi:dipeptidyl aminopeptidase/acylaminoacyl peptidase
MKSILWAATVVGCGVAMGAFAQAAPTRDPDWAVQLKVVIGTPGRTAPAKRLITLDDMAREREVADPQVSPDGAWVAYTIAQVDVKADKAEHHIWMASWDGARRVQLTSRSGESESTPRFSPDGRWLTFISGRTDEHDEDQLWALDRAGGEAVKLTDFNGSVDDCAWSPDGTRLALIVEDPDPDADAAKDAPPKPIVIDRFMFEEDVKGYLGPRREHLYLFDLATRKAERLTDGDWDEALPAWSPDGRRIVFVSKRRADADRDENTDLYVIDARPGSSPRQLTTWPGPDNHPDWNSRPAWSPDGKWIAYLQGGPLKLIEYAVQHLAIVPAAGGEPAVLTRAVDRNVNSPVWSSGSDAVQFLEEDDRVMHLESVTLGGKVTEVVGGRRVISALSRAPDGHEAVLAEDLEHAPEVFAVDGGALRPLSRANDAWLTELRLASIDEVGFKSRDGTEVHGFIARPPDYQRGRRYPTLLVNHGGPVSQFQDEWPFAWQLYAAQGYVVVASNPRGSSGRGEAWAKAIYADWGDKDAQDVLAGVDNAIAQGLADPDRLGVLGWSYGGMLTNYVIAQDHRFKAARSGASISDILAGYGTDEYVRDYENELGRPWENTEGWLKLSFPFLHADRITTPTLFMGGDLDMNVPLQNVKQMYQALKSLGVDTELIIYPGQYHDLTRPSFLRDRLDRDLKWFDAHLAGG